MPSVAINPSFGVSTLSTTVTAAGNSTARFSVSAPPLATGATADAITGTVSGGQGFNHAELFLTHDGVVVAAAPLDSYLNSNQGTLTLNGIAPGGSTAASFAAGVYYAEMWAWNSADPTGTLVRSPNATAIDMSAGNASGVALTIP